MSPKRVLWSAAAVAILAGMCLLAGVPRSEAGEALLRLATSQPLTGGYMGDTPKVFAEALEKATKGQVKVKVFPGSLSQNERELALMAQSGAVDIAIPATTNILGWAPSLKVFDLPYLFEGVTHFKNVVRGPVGQRIASEIEGNGVVMLAYLLPGVRSIFNNVRPIQTLEDAKNMKIRTMESPVYLETFKSLNMLPTPMPSSELYTSLQLGVVDAGENDPASVVSWGWIDVIKYYSLDEHSISCMAVIMNKQRFQSFSPDIQMAIRDAAREAETYQLDYIEKAWADSLKKIEAKGVKINKVENKKPFQDAVRHIVDKYDKEIGNNLVQMVRDTPKK